MTLVSGLTLIGLEEPNGPPIGLAEMIRNLLASIAYSDPWPTTCSHHPLSMDSLRLSGRKTCAECDMDGMIYTVGMSSLQLDLDPEKGGLETVYVKSNCGSWPPNTRGNGLWMVTFFNKGDA